MTLIVSIICLAIIAFIWWWFFGHHEEDGKRAQRRSGYQEIEVEVMGGYSPSRIILKKDVPARIVFHRKDPSSCLDQIVFPDFGVHADLPLNDRYVVEITPKESGTYGFACGMNMMHGQLIVE
ncbi:cupredoxin domain-containing protein [Streptococcus sp. DD13]|uniref:cupredoxin domain-containing protein n=1 Tax=Streptococcus sp. DD13 TaxID=1777881 RepID=UPI00079131B7|nr:cupredoxin domain-containing protein [Streptococcus sp. DD13]KXT78210.1 Copper-exporting ATPase [Streptococcus sp. DD13]